MLMKNVYFRKLTLKQIIRHKLIMKNMQKLPKIEIIKKVVTKICLKI